MSFRDHLISKTILIVAALTLAACGESTVDLVDEPVVRPIKMVTVGAADSATSNQFPAVVGANRLSSLSLQVSGKLIEFPVKQAQVLKAGDLIAKLDQQDLISNLNSIQAQYDNASDEFERAQRLAKEDAIAKSVLDQRKAQFEVSKAQLKQAQKALADSELRAPFSGVVAETMVKRLQTVSAGEPVISLMSEDLFEATIDLPASFIARIPKDAAESKDRQAFVILDAVPNQLIPAEFKEAKLIADAASQTYAVTFTFPPPANLNVLPGMNATMELRNSGKSDTARVTVPMSSVLSEGNDTFVWAVDMQSMTVSKRAVELEPGVGEMLVVKSGLAVNDVIAGAGAAYLTEGLKVRKWN